MNLVATRRDAYELIHDGILALARAERNGMRVDMDYVREMEVQLTKQINGLEKELDSYKFIRLWKHVFGTKFKVLSGDQLSYILFDKMDYKPLKQTTKGQASTDDESLQLLGVGGMDVLLKLRKLLKLRDTYLANFTRETVNGYMHPFFSLHTARTYRSSSQMPNFQNIPKRDKESMKIIRGAIYPRPGHFLMEADFGALEVSIAYTYHNDPVMRKYLLSKNADMHSDMASQIFKIKNFDKHQQYHKTLRDATKHGFVFPQFYGDYYKNNAEGLRNWIKVGKGQFKASEGVFVEEGVHMGQHLRSVGIPNFAAFTEHLKRVEGDFWNNRFSAFGKWRKEWMRAYQKKGYFDMHTGFRCVGVMRRNEVWNFPVQGAAFHCLLQTFIWMDEWLRANNMDTRLIGQIHDAMVLDVHPDEADEVIAQVRYLTTQRLLEHWRWINIPLKISIDVGEVDGSWAVMNEIV